MSKGKESCPYCKKEGFNDNSLFEHLVAGIDSCPQFLANIDKRMSAVEKECGMELPVIRPLPPLPC